MAKRRKFHLTSHKDSIITLCGRKVNKEDMCLFPLDTSIDSQILEMLMERNGCKNCCKKMGEEE